MIGAKGVIENIFTLPVAVGIACSLSVPLTSCQSHGPTSRHLRGLPDGSVIVEAMRMPSLSTPTVVSPSSASKRSEVEPAGAAADIVAGHRLRHAPWRCSPSARFCAGAGK